MHPAYESVYFKLMDLEWNYTRWVLMRDKQTGETILDRIWIDQEAEKLHNHLSEILAKELLAAREKEAALHGLYPMLPRSVFDPTP